ncbi:hypothetical protein INT47_005854 [Mucor saturninus]|uniref:Uncharacterized protein n=1 Tax=Mucor saturninus TaxID=64648 RepID=A0A8H7UVE7_9FUNG|nr:hypothetical protein INT47_005854 [Mucor saturninus]
MFINEDAQSTTLQIQALARQLEEIRIQLQQQSAPQRMDEDLDHDPQIVERPIATDLIPTDRLQEALPGMCDDFFRFPLDELDCKRFIHVCPRNVIRQYLPPILNLADNVGRFTKQTDNQLSEVQRRLAATTRPMDKFLHDSLRSNASSVPITDVIDFVNTIHTLVSDTASYITQLRMDNVSRETGLVAPPIPLKTKLTPSPQPLFQDPKAILENTNLRKAVQAASRKPQRKSQYRQRPQQNSGNSQPRSNQGGKPNKPKRQVRFSFDTVHDPQEDRRRSTSIEPQAIESIPTTNTVQNGNNENDMQLTSTGPLHDQYRSYRCISPCISSRIVEEIPTVSLEQSHISISNHSVRSIFESNGFHQDIETSVEMGTSFRDSLVSLPGRSIGSGEVSSYYAVEHQKVNTKIDQFRVLGQPKEITFNTHDAYSASGISNQYRDYDSYSTYEQNPGYSSSGPKALTPNKGKTNGFDVVYRQGTSNVFGSFSSKAPYTSIDSTGQPIETFTTIVDSIDRSCQTEPPVVDLTFPAMERTFFYPRTSSSRTICSRKVRK